MLLALMQSVGMGGGESSAVVVVQAGGKKTHPRRRRYRDAEWKRDILYATAALQRELTEAAKQRAAQAEEVLYTDDVEEAYDLVSGAVAFVSGGLNALPPPPEPVARAIVAIEQEQPDYRAILSAIKEARKRERDTAERKRISIYQGLVMAAHRREVSLRDDDEAIMWTDLV